MLLGDSQPVETMLAELATENPIERAAYISEFPSFSSDLDIFATAIEQSNDPVFVSGMVLAAGRILKENLKTGDTATWVPLLFDLYRKDPEGGTHSAAEWTVTSWELTIPRLDAQQHPGWQITLEWLKLIRIPADDREHSPSGPTDDVVDKNFWMSDKEVTTGLFRRFHDDESYDGKKPEDWTGVDPNVNATPDHPVQTVPWIDAVLFCN